MSESARFALPFLVPGQAAKEVMHNEALQQAEMLLQPVIDSGPVSSPPASPAVGDMAIVAGGATGDFSGQDDSIALFTVDGWRFFAPFGGCAVYENGSGDVWRYSSGGEWAAAGLSGSSLVINGVQVVGAQQVAIAEPQGGSGADTKARTAISEILTALRNHGLIAT